MCLAVSFMIGKAGARPLRLSSLILALMIYEEKARKGNESSLATANPAPRLPQSEARVVGRVGCRRHGRCSCGKNSDGPHWAVRSAMAFVLLNGFSNRQSPFGSCGTHGRPR